MVDKLSDIQEDTWAINNELIDRLSLKPDTDQKGLQLHGEDGNFYGFCDILKAHMDWIEKRITWRTG